MSNIFHNTFERVETNEQRLCIVALVSMRIEKPVGINVPKDCDREGGTDKNGAFSTGYFKKRKTYWPIGSSFVQNVLRKSPAVFFSLKHHREVVLTCC